MAGKLPRFTEQYLDGLIEDATVDAYTESEQTGGFATMIGDHLALPFHTQVLGQEVSVVKIDLNESDQIVAICVRGKARQPIPILDLPLPHPPPEGVEWIEAYRRWCTM
jgi:hypothetical protein